MTTTVTVSEFRNNLSKYLDLLVKRGIRVKLIDGRKGEVKATLANIKEDEFDREEWIKFVLSLGGSGLLASKKDEEARKRFRRSLNKRFNKAKKC